MTGLVCSGCHRQIESNTTAENPCPFCGFIAPPPGSSDDYLYHGLNLRILARRQRQLLWLILAGLVAYAHMVIAVASSTGSLMFVGLVLWLACMAAALIGMLRMVAALRHGVALSAFVIFTCWMPFINLFILLFVNNLATKALRQAGLRVGFMGVKDDDVVRRLSPYLCLTCGYNLTGNVSGICPECGSVARDRLPSRLREENKINP